MKFLRPVAIGSAELLSTNVPANEFPEWADATIYAAQARVQRLNLVYESVAAGNQHHNPTTDVAQVYWLLVGASNALRMFDAAVSTVTTNPESIQVTIQPPGIVDSLAVLNVAGTVAHVQQYTADGLTLVLDRTITLSAHTLINDWATYFFEESDKVDFFTITDLRLYPSSRITVTIENPGGVAACGYCIPGLSRQLGATKWGATVGIQDYSRKQADDWGDIQVVKRAFAKRANFDVWVATDQVSTIQNLMARYRAEPLVWIGDDAVGALVVMGFYKDFQLELSYPDVSLFTLQIEGLT